MGLWAVAMDGQLYSRGDLHQMEDAKLSMKHVLLMIDMQKRN